MLCRGIFPLLCNFVKESDRVLRDFLYSIFSKLLVVVLLGMAIIIFFFFFLIELLSDEIILSDIGPFLWILPVFILLLFCNLPLSLLIIALDNKKMYFNYHLIGLITALFLIPFLISFLEINGLLISIALAELASASLVETHVVVTNLTSTTSATISAFTFSHVTFSNSSLLCK